MLKVKDRKASARVSIIIRRRINMGPAPAPGEFREIPVRAHLAVGHVLLGGVEIDPRLRYFDSAGFSAVAEPGVAGWIIHPQPVHDEPVIVKTWNGRRRGRSPNAIFTSC